jgi:hypothetical protein
MNLRISGLRRMATSGADAAATAATADVLKLARQATGVPDLHPYKLRVENGQLVKLDLRGLKLAALPDSIGQLGALQDLNLGGNELASLPASLCVQLTALKKLNLSGNKLSSVPGGFGRLTVGGIAAVGRWRSQHQLLGVDFRSAIV